MTTKTARNILVIFLTLNSLCHAKETVAPTVPTDFTRDIMQPIGMPVVSSYHTLRESLFLNTKVPNKNPIETIGNFFLTPSRYLFAGKKIILHNPDSLQYEIIQTHQYKKLFWLKALVSVIAFPVSETLGILFKGLAFLSPEVRHRHHTIEKALKSPFVKSCLEEYQKKGLDPLYSEAFIPCQDHKRPSFLTKKQKAEIQALKEVVHLFEANNIVYWIDCGTALGAYRYGGIIPWDWDIDISILLPDHENVKKILSTLDPEKYQIQDWSSYTKPQTFLKLYVKETHNFIDIYHYQINEDKRNINYVFTYIDSPFPDSWKKTELKCIQPLSYEEMFPLKKAQFDDMIVWAPNDIVTFLKSKYGDNLDPVMVWQEETKSYRKVQDHPYYQ